jgi:hypothetical protein
MHATGSAACEIGGWNTWFLTITIMARSCQCGKMELSVWQNGQQLIINNEGQGMRSKGRMMSPTSIHRRAAAAVPVGAHWGSKEHDGSVAAPLGNIGLLSCAAGAWAACCKLLPCVLVFCVYTCAAFKAWDLKLEHWLRAWPAHPIV